MNELCLLDIAVTETNAIKLKFLNVNGEVKEIIDDHYKPYFLTTYPLTTQEEETTKLFCGKVTTVQKTDLFSGQIRVLTKISWPNVKIATQAAKHFRQVWENEVEFRKSYAYDNGLVFGAMHSENNLKPVSVMPMLMEEKFKVFDETRGSDPLKHAQIRHWFDLLTQPIPQTSLSLLGIENVDAERLHTVWVLSRIANIPLTEAFHSNHVSDWLKSIIHSYLRRKNILIPTADELTKGEPTHTVAGALTVAPKSGIYFNTVVCDFESLYPSCIDSFNLSYETVNCEHGECSENKIPDFDGHVCTRQRGFYCTLIGALKELRIKLFKPASKNDALAPEGRKKAAAVAKLLKLILVSSYGVTIRIHGLACPPLAEAITGYGRYALKESWRMAEMKGMLPLYGDTDSLFLDNASNEQVAWLIENVKERFHLDLAIDKQYTLCVLPKAKKAYFGILRDGTPDIKGVTATKSNSPAYINKVFQKCVNELATVKNLKEYEMAKAQVKKIVQKSTDDLKKGLIPLRDLAYSVRLYFDPNEKTDHKMIHQPYQCAIQLIDSGRKLKRGDTVSFIKVKPFKYKGKNFTVRPVESISNLGDVNLEDYVRNLFTALDQTFEPMGIQLEAEKKIEISRWLGS